MTQVQLAYLKKTIEEIDKWVTEKGFKSRSDIIRAIINPYDEREKTRKFLRADKSKQKDEGTLGDYCVIYEINKDKSQVIILFIGLRKEV